MKRLSWANSTARRLLGNRNGWRTVGADSNTEFIHWLYWSSRSQSISHYFLNVQGERPGDMSSEVITVIAGDLGHGDNGSVIYDYGKETM